MLRVVPVSGALCALLAGGAMAVGAPIFTLLSSYREVEGVGIVPGSEGAEQRDYELSHDSPMDAQTAGGATLQIGLYTASAASTVDTFVNSGRIGVRNYASVSLIHPVAAAGGSLFAEGVSLGRIEYRLNRPIQALLGYTTSGSSNSDNGVMGVGGGSFARWDEATNEWVSLLGGPGDDGAPRGVLLDPGLYSMQFRLYARVSNTAQAADIVVHQGEAYVVVIPAPGAAAVVVPLGVVAMSRRRRR